MPKLTTTPGIVTKTAFAARVGLSKGRISQLVAQGLPVLPDGRIEVEAALRWLDDNLDPARRRAAAVGAGAGMSADASTGSFAEARRQHEWAKAKRALLQLEKERGELVDRRRACDLVFRLGRQERDAWLNWPARVAAIIAAELRVDTHAMQTALEKHVRAHLAELAEVKLPL